MTAGPVGRNAATEAFFDGTAAGQFLIRRCRAEGRLLRPQARFCEACRSTDLEWVPASGRAHLISWSVVPSRPTGDDAPLPPPLIPAIGQLDEGPWWWSMIVGADADQLAEGTPLIMDFDRVEGSEAVPVFRLA